MGQKSHLSMQKLGVKSGCAVLSVINGEVLKGGSTFLLLSRSEALAEFREAKRGGSKIRRPNEVAAVHCLLLLCKDHQSNFCPP